MVTSDFRPEVEIRPVRACAMHPAIIIGTVRSLLTWLWGRYHVPQKAFLVFVYFHSKEVMRVNFLRGSSSDGLRVICLFVCSMPDASSTTTKISKKRKPKT